MVFDHARGSSMPSSVRCQLTPTVVAGRDAPEQIDVEILVLATNRREPGLRRRCSRSCRASGPAIPFSTRSLGAVRVTDDVRVTQDAPRIEIPRYVLARLSA